MLESKLLDKQRTRESSSVTSKEKNSVFCPLIPDILVFKSNSWIDLCVFWFLNPTRTLFGTKFTCLPSGNGSHMATSQNQEVLSSSSAQSPSCSSHSEGDLETADPPKKKSCYHCCVPKCNGDSRYDSSLRFHRIPSKTKDAKLRVAWLVKIRRDEGPNFQVGVTN